MAGRERPHPGTVTDPLMPERNLTEAFLLALALFTSVQVVFLHPEPSAVDVLLGPGWAAIWAVSLFAGSVLALAGLYWRGRSLVGASLMQIGYAAFAPAALARGVALLGAGHLDDAVVIFAFGVVSLARLAQLERRIGRHYPSGAGAWAWRRVWRWHR